MEDKLKQQEMKQANDLSDIVLEKESGSSVDKTKKILLYAASLILLFLVALVAMKLFNTSPQEHEDTLAQIGNEIQQPVDESIDQISQKLEDTNKLFQQEPIIDESAETDLKFEEMVRKLKAQDAAEQEVDTTVAKTAQQLTEKVAAKKEEVKDLFNQKADAITKAAKEELPDIKKAAHVPQEETRKVIPPKVVEAPVKPKPKVQPAPKKETKREIVAATRVEQAGSETKLSSLSGYFIQVGATANVFPDRRYLQKIKNAGYDYVVHSMLIKGRKIKKILIGPYASRAEAKRHLPAVQAKINPSAYIYRVQ